MAGCCGTSGARRRRRVPSSPIEARRGPFRPCPASPVQSKLPWSTESKSEEQSFSLPRPIGVRHNPYLSTVSGTSRATATTDAANTPRSARAASAQTRKCWRCCGTCAPCAPPPRSRLSLVLASVRHSTTSQCSPSSVHTYGMAMDRHLQRYVRVRMAGRGMVGLSVLHPWRPRGLGRLCPHMRAAPGQVPLRSDGKYA